MANYRNKYSNEEILHQLRAHYKRNGKITKKIFDSDKTVCSTITVNKKFGSWKKALKMLDLEKEYRNVMDKFFNPHKYSEQLSKYFENM